MNKKKIIVVAITVIILTVYTSCSNQDKNTSHQNVIDTTLKIADGISEQKNTISKISENPTSEATTKKSVKKNKSSNKESKKDKVTTKEHSTTIKKYILVNDGTTREVTSSNYVTTTNKNEKQTAESTTEKTSDSHDLEPDFD